MISSRILFQPFRNFLAKNAFPESSRRADFVKVLKAEVIEQRVVEALVKETEVYSVRILFDENKVEEAACTCPYNQSGVCKHIIKVIAEVDLEVYASFHSNSVLEKVKLPGKGTYWHYPEKNILDLTYNDIQDLQLIPSADKYFSDYYYRFISGTSDKNYLTAQFNFQFTSFEVQFRQKTDGFYMKCSCDDNPKILCEHLTAVLNHRREDEAFQLAFDLEKRTAKLEQGAKEYGLVNSSHDLEKLFTFDFEKDRVHIRSKINLMKFSPEKLAQLANSINETSPLPWENKLTEKKQIVIMNYNRYYGQFTIELRSAKITKGGELKSPIEPVSTSELYDKAETKAEFDFARALIEWSHVSAKELSFDQLSHKIKLVKKIKENPHNFDFYYFDDDGGKITPSKLTAFDLAVVQPNVVLSIVEDGEFYVLTGKFEFDNRNLSSGSFKLMHQIFVRYGQKFYLFDSTVAIQMHHFLTENNNQLFIHKDQFEGFREAFLDKLERSVSVNYSFIRKADKKELKDNGILERSEKMLYLSESEDYILLTPVMLYGDVEFPILSKRSLFLDLPTGEKAIAERNTWAEQGFIRLLRSLHPDFSNETHQDFYFLHRSEFLENGWFLDAFEKLRSEDIEILGFAQLSKNRYNPNKSSISTGIISGIDWFDVHANVKFGNQEARLADIQKAVLNKTRYVKLGDGTHGILPDEWINKMASFFRTAEISGEYLRVHKSNFQIVDELFKDEVIDEPIRFELQAYQNKLANFHSISQTKVPKKLKATLRDYQKEGLNWLNFLDEFGFGGCLADDMGLGKTIQVIAYLMQQIEKGNTAPNLIVLPKSLLFNWKEELKKFAPHLTYFEWYGANRNVKTSFGKYNIILTTYGTVLSDIEVLRKETFNCIVLDESQAIKNPTSKRYKSVRLLNGRQRLVLTGTPIENNTFDLYAQLSFAMPGIFGSAKQFADLYSTPIDRFQDTARAKELQRKIHPFVLRRTKKQVAKELPEKTEMVLYCEMGTEQKRIYETYKKEFQQFLKDKSNEELNRESMHILQGMIKLRQICNSPATLSDEEYYGSESAKIDELVNQIEEKKGEHKMLVFSQFVTMLDLIKERLDQAGIKTAYLTGKTNDRQGQVDQFQNDDETRVFLISLKAGGTGLNLTRADYVFLVDPWWNPAVENQAIDRAYRIGQDKHVVAVRLITPDTIEEKIRELQARKKELADDLIHTDTSMLKALNKTDLLELLN